MNKQALAATTAIGIARKNECFGAMTTSARCCVDDARTCYDRKDYKHACERALKSLAYSVGITHADYKSVQSLIASQF